MKTAVLTGIKQIVLEDRPDPVRANSTDVIIRTRAVGVCGSDVHYFLHGKIGTQQITGPHILGHECAGEIVEIGMDVPAELKPGMRVAIEPGIPCGKCELCQKGTYNLCTQIKFLGTPPYDGAYREYLCLPYTCLYPVTDNISYAAAALVEPLAVAIHAVNLARLRVRDTIAVLGCGSIGLTVLRTAILNGTGQCFITDKLDYRLDLARKYGVGETVNVNTYDPVQFILAKTKGRGVDVVFEAAGQPETFSQTVNLVRPGGKIILIGICTDEYVPLNFGLARRKGVTIKLVRRFAHTYPRAIELVEQDLINLEWLVSHQFSLNQIVTAFNLVENYADFVLKPIIFL